MNRFSRLPPPPGVRLDAGEFREDVRRAKSVLEAMSGRRFRLSCAELFGDRTFAVGAGRVD